MSESKHDSLPVVDNYKPNGMCDSCRFCVLLVFGNGRTEPLEGGSECGISEQLSKLADTTLKVMVEVQEGEDDLFNLGEDNEELELEVEWGQSRPCPLHVPWQICESHGLHKEPTENMCPQCHVEADEAYARMYAEENDYWDSLAEQDCTEQENYYQNTKLVPGVNCDPNSRWDMQAYKEQQERTNNLPDPRDPRAGWSSPEK